MIIKIMDIIKFTNTFQNFVKLVGQVLLDVIAYFSFLILWVLVFAFFYQSLGVGIRNEMSIFNYLADSWKMSTKTDEGVIQVDYWKVKEDRTDIRLYSLFMTFFV